MENIYIDTRSWNKWLKNRFPVVDFISLEQLLGDYEDLINEVDDLKEKIEDMESDIRDNYKPISYAEQVGISDSDFI